VKLTAAYSSFVVGKGVDGDELLVVVSEGGGGVFSVDFGEGVGDDELLVVGEGVSGDELLVLGGEGVSDDDLLVTSVLDSSFLFHFSLHRVHS
jgi:hypothetical protein